MTRKIPLSAVLVSRRRPVAGLVTGDFRAYDMIAPFSSRIVADNATLCSLATSLSPTSSTTMKTRE